MAILLPKEKLITSTELLDLARARRKEAGLLFDAGQYATAMYLAGYSVECLLKAAICRALDWDWLLGTFKTHDLEGLLLYSGLDRKLRADPQVLRSFSRLKSQWPGNLRYQQPASIDRLRADQFLKSVSDPKIGVATWLQNNIR